MPVRWGADSVLALAPDAAAARTAQGLAKPAPWTQAGATGDAVWGQCQGSGAAPYQTVVDLTGPAYKCSCPSRKFPCKHALALLLLWSAGSVPDEDSPADFAAAWLDKRKDKSLSRTPQASSLPAPASSQEGSAVTTEGQATAGPAIVVKDEAAAVKRAAERAARVNGGLSELTEWLRDQVRVGLAAAAGVPGQPGGAVDAGRTGGAGGPVAAVAARMVDAQAKGVAGTLKGLASIPAKGDDWPASLLSEYAMLHLLARAHERLGSLPPELASTGLAATVRSRVGYTTGRADVLASPPVTDQWDVLSVRDLTNGDVPGRRVWLRGRATERFAMLLTFAAGPAGWSDLATARLRPGTEFRADLHFYPGQPPTRALTGTRHTEPARARPPVPDDGIDAMLAGYAAGLEQDPWLTTWPVLLDGTPVAPGGGRDRWHLADRSGAALPLQEALRETGALWTLLAVSGGHPVTVAGEWHPGDGLLPLTVWLDDQAVAL